MTSKSDDWSLMHKAFISAKDNIVKMVSRFVPPKEIEDIVQETYVRICQVEHKQEIQQPRAFLMTTARNLAIDHLKRSETKLSDELCDEWCLFDSENEAKDAVFEQVATNEEFAHFCESVRLLPLQCRKVFVLKKVYGYSQKEIAKELGISESTVEKHIITGFKRCASYMAKFDTPHFANSTNKARVSQGKLL